MDKKNIYLISADKKIKDKLKIICAPIYKIKIIKGISKNYSNILVLIDLTKYDISKIDLLNKKTILNNIATGIAENNLSIIAIINENQIKFSENLLKLNFYNFIEYPFINPKIHATLRNNLKNQENIEEINKLNQIGIELSAEKNLDKLLKNILTTCCEITGSDGGSIYIVLPAENHEFKTKMLSFELSQSDTLGNRYEKFTLPINKNSIAGYVACTKKVLNIADCYKIPKNAEYKFFDSFDKANNYITRSMMCVPMIDHVGEVIGVIQLINRKSLKGRALIRKLDFDKYIIPFDSKCERLVRSLTSQAAVSIENTMLYKELKDIFDSFIQAAALAVESRDPSTAGHSRRVSVFSIALAREINKEKKGPLSKIKFSDDDVLQIRYAALLHDFGKIGVSEQVLTKAEKLLLSEFENIKERFEIIRYHIRMNVKDNEAKEKELLKIEEYFKLLEKAKIPGKLTDEEKNTLKELAKLKYITSKGEVKSYLTDKELTSYLLENGSLTAEEKDMIRTHVFHSYKFLDEIPWPESLKKIPKIAFAHHELMDGSGYPNKLKNSEIPIEAQIICVADVYDALIASDRPYKKKITPENSIEILRKEADKGKLNKDLVELFVKSRIYEKYEF